MTKFKIGVISDSFRLSVKDGLRKAAEVGADGVQIYAVSGDMAPENMDDAARAEFRRFCESLNLEISALCGDLGGHGFQLRQKNVTKIPRSVAIVDLAVALGTKVVTTHIGVVPEDKGSEIYAAMLDACRILGDYAEKKGVTFAIETGPETAETLCAFLDDVGSAGIGVNLDPANLVMVTGDDPVKAVHTLKKYIVHTHAKDGVKLAPCNAAEVYGAFAVGGVEGFDMGKLFNEVPLGKGSVDWPRYLAALSEIGYNGYLTIEREVGDDPEADIRAAVDFLKEKI